jgi:hypothetical protein
LSPTQLANTINHSPIKVYGASDQTHLESVAVELPLCPRAKLAMSQHTNLLSHFSYPTLVKGRDYLLRRKVLQSRQLASNEIVGKVTGSTGQTYDVEIRLRHDRKALQRTRCSCPIGEDCKHSVAVLLSYLQNEGSDTASSVDHSRSATPADINARLIAYKTVKENSKEQAVSHGYTNSQADLGKSVSLDASFVNGLERVARTLHQFQPGVDHSRGISSSKRRTALIYTIPKVSHNRSPKIEVNSVSLCKNGSFGAVKSFQVERLLSYSPPEYASQEDIDLANFHQSLKNSNSRYLLRNEYSHQSPEILRLLFNRVLETNRCYFERDFRAPLKLGSPLPGKLEWTQLEDDTWRLTVKAVDADFSYPCLQWNIPWYVDEERFLFGPVNFACNPQVLDTLLTLPAVSTAGAAWVPKFLFELGLSSLIPNPPVEGAVQIKLVPPSCSLEMKCLPCKKPVFSKDGIVAREGENVRLLSLNSSFKSPAKDGQLDELGRRVIERLDATALEVLPQPLMDMGLTEVNATVFGLDGSAERLFVQPQLSNWLSFGEKEVGHLRSLGWQISEETERLLNPVDLGIENLTFEVEETDSWWFSLSLNVDVQGKSVPLLPIMIAAIRGLRTSEQLTDSVDALNQNGKFVACLPSGHILCLPFERIRSVLLSLQEMVQKGVDGKHLSASALALSELLENHDLSKARWLGAQNLLSIVDRLRKLKSIDQVSVPEQFKAALRPYQIEGLSWLQFMAQQSLGGILADDMGLGKTVQLLAHVLLEKESGRLTKPFLVICPTSVLPNWISEASKFAPDLKVMQFHGENRAVSFSKMRKVDLVVTTYPLLLRDFETLKKITWHGMALDEAQAIKNHKTKLSTAARGLKCGHRFCLSGTPVENHLGELWAQFQFLLPGLLGDEATFRQCFRTPIEKEGNVELKKILARRIRPFVLRRTKSEVATELPAKTVIVQHVQLGNHQSELYETVRLATTKRVRDEIATKGFRQSQILILDALLKLRQSCCDPRLVKLTAAKTVKESSKLGELMEMVVQLIQEGRKILVFSQFTSMLDLIASELKEKDLDFVKLTGDTKDRATPVSMFQNGTVSIFLISLKAGGTGLNLTAADTVIHYDPWWNPAVEDQATDRAHRIGQDKKVFVYKLIARGTIEQRMLELQERKRVLASSIYDERGNLSLAFSEKDLDALLRPIDFV